MFPVDSLVTVTSIKRVPVTADDVSGLDKFGVSIVLFTSAKTNLNLLQNRKMTVL